MDQKLDLKDIVLIGRTFDEYYSMFDLANINDKDDKILDVASGVSSFCTEANYRGYNVTASDRIYCFSAAEIEEKCIKDLIVVLGKLPDIADLYKWDFFKDIEDLKQNRKKAYKLFIKDLKEKGSKRYIYTEYPKSEFVENEFSISLISHFLFMYDEQLDYEFHKQTILEIIKITSDEVRIFPIVNLKARRSLLVNQLMNDRDLKNCEITIKKVNYEFVKNGNEMLIIRKK